MSNRNKKRRQNKCLTCPKSSLWWSLILCACVPAYHKLSTFLPRLLECWPYRNGCHAPHHLAIYLLHLSSKYKPDTSKGRQTLLSWGFCSCFLGTFCPVNTTQPLEGHNKVLHERLLGRKMLGAQPEQIYGSRQARLGRWIRCFRLETSLMWLWVRVWA